jgi:hypothetical protein
MSILRLPIRYHISPREDTTLLPHELELLVGFTPIGIHNHDLAIIDSPRSVLVLIVDLEGTSSSIFDLEYAVFAHTRSNLSTLESDTVDIEIVAHILDEVETLVTGICWVPSDGIIEGPQSSLAGSFSAEMDVVIFPHGASGRPVLRNGDLV